MLIFFLTAKGLWFMLDCKPALKELMLISIKVDGYEIVFDCVQENLYLI